MTPAKEVGGDFYDFFLLDEDHIALVIADVSGKGVPAALFMMIAKRLIRSSLQNGMTPGKALEQVNNQLLENNEMHFFVTVWLAVIDLKTGDGHACNAGHEDPVLKRKGEDYQLLIYPHSKIVAFLPDQIFEEHSFHLDPGDRIFVYTDGVPEAQNEKEEFFGEDRMIECLNQNPDVMPEQTLSGMTESIRSFAGAAEQFDDITMLSFLYLGKN
jgi:sigma-B regulation protein RsbU (phosphoserine phosphatase)